MALSNAQKILDGNQNHNRLNVCQRASARKRKKTKLKTNKNPPNHTFFLDVGFTDNFCLKPVSIEMVRKQHYKDRECGVVSFDVQPSKMKLVLADILPLNTSSRYYHAFESSLHRKKLHLFIMLPLFNKINENNKILF